MIDIAPRGCGKPKEDCLYLSIPTSEHGIPWYKFLLDPTIPVPADLGLKKMGFQYVRRGDVCEADGTPIYDIFDWIGEKGYRNAPDWFLEVKHLGFHQLIPMNKEIKLLSHSSMYYAIHRRAGIEHPTEVTKIIDAGNDAGNSDEFPDCIKLHNIEGTTCPWHLMNAIEGGKLMFPNKKDATDFDKRVVLREMPSFSYTGAKPSSKWKIKYVPSIFFKIPIGMMARYRYYDGHNEKRRQLLMDVLPQHIKDDRLEIIDLEKK